MNPIFNRIATAALCAAVFAPGCGGDEEPSPDPSINKGTTCEPVCGTGEVCRDGSCVNNSGGLGFNSNFNGTSKGGTGDTCSKSEDCTSELCAVGSSGSGFCTEQCTPGSCPSPYTCQEPQPSLAVCLPASGSGNGSTTHNDLNCSALIDCIINCPDNDNQCANACYSRTDQQSYDLFIAYATCIQNSGCNSQESCQQACAGEAQACAGDQGGSQTTPPPANSDLGCYDLNECLGQCSQNDESCAQACFGQTDQQSYDLLAAVYQCFQNSGCSNQQECEQACAQQIQACVSDS